jgi:pimeloyl-ACP methyl ester carboxylesterase
MLIHGGLGDAALHWETVWEPLAETFTVAAPNLPSAQPPHVPTLLLWGDADRMTPVSRGQALVRSIPSARLQPILGAGHMPQLDKPTDFVDVVKRFISR